MRSYYFSVLSGRRRGWGPALFKALLTLAAGVYWFLHAFRRGLYRVGLLRSVRLDVPVISVGNLTAGGTGKTPVVEALARWFAARRLRTAILARGYGRIDPENDDENLLFEVDNVVRLTGRDRLRSARKARRDFRADVIVLDDGFQHYRIARDLDILLVDATNPFAEGRLIPRGLLRESPRNAARADLILLTRVDQVEPDALESLRDRLSILSGGRPVLESVHRPTYLRSLWNKKRVELDWLRGRRVYAFSGLGNPDSFRRTLEAVGAHVVMSRAFPDHHRYTVSDVRYLNLEAQEFMAGILVTTEKDATKLHPESFELPLYALRVEIEVTQGEDLLEGALRGALRGRLPAPAEVTPR